MPESLKPSLQAAWIAVDWGTTHLRAWAVDANHKVLASASSDKGMATLEPAEFESALLQLVKGWLGRGDTLSVLACGMVGARQGWAEADYLPVPSAPLVPARFQPANALDPRIEVSVIPGLKQPDPPDVMRGEETQIAGFLAQHPQFDGVVCMPGTHTKWANVAQGQVLRFQSYMTGEVFSLLARHSVLRHSLGGEGFDMETFAETLPRVLDEPSLAISGLFPLRADDLLNGACASALRARLSAYLIGMEVHAAASQWQGADTALIGAPKLTRLYSQALSLKGCAPAQFDADGLTLEGLFTARELQMNAEA